MKTYGLGASKTLQSLSEDKILQTYHSDQVFEFTFNQPKKLNALDHEVVEAINSTLDKWKLTKHPKVVIFAPGKGHKSFCAGGDIKVHYNMMKNGDNQDVSRMQHLH